MNRHQFGEDRAPPTLVKKLDRWAGELNAFLTVFAVGLAIMEFTCFVALKAQSSLPPPHVGNPNIEVSETMPTSMAVR